MKLFTQQYCTQKRLSFRLAYC